MQALSLAVGMSQRMAAGLTLWRQGEGRRREGQAGFPSGSGPNQNNKHY